MASERTTQIDTTDYATTTPDSEAPWSDLEVAIPNDRDHASLVALVECALVELTHEAVGAVFVSHQVWGTNRTQYVAVDDVSEQFQKRHFDARLGWHETIVPRETVRDALITQLTRSTTTPVDTQEAAAGKPGTFTVKPVRDFQTPSRLVLTNTSDRDRHSVG
ncbi:hypothetical protein C474_08777 [Halogeometricum pallidum JCM 14848]|uniref:DUF8030 domain-containing protein n=1 Tax=Halogeometricum pallidum JCM 14848 TaxID=1227487 RepID=M0D974_HALPD|nr:hypothetical protein [Halogeometricum pallidum]ELZ31383.1 hypothetical protein C474_08777 [Halogeometricum pallidum JCM 14848]